VLEGDDGVAEVGVVAAIVASGTTILTTLFSLVSTIVFSLLLDCISPSNFRRTALAVLSNDAGQTAEPADY
jgi:hypothetical protein